MYSHRTLFKRALHTAVCILGLLSVALPVQAQNLDLLIKGGHVIDPKNGINQVMDVGIAGGRIAAVEQNIPASRATKVVDASGLYVSPGFIDLHVHVFFGTEQGRSYNNSFSAVQADPFTFRSGVTTVVDAGSPGWRNIGKFIEQTVENSDTRVLTFLNIAGEGMAGMVEQNVNDMDPRMTAAAARRYRDVVVGVKLAHFSGPDWTPTDRAVEAGTLAGIPVMVDFGGANPPLPIEELFMEHLRPGDIFTHAFGQLRSRESIVDAATGKLKPLAVRAQERGIIFDAGHGGGSFAWSQAVPATQQGFWPNTISTDLHVSSMNAGMKDQANVMSKFLVLGMPLDQVIAASTWRPAQVIKRTELGNLDVGAEADVAIFEVLEGSFGYVDSRDAKLMGNRKIEPEVTIRAGEVVWDLNGLTAPLWNE